MKTNNKSLGLGTRFQNLTLATVNGYGKTFLLSFTMTVLFLINSLSVSAQGNDSAKPMYRQFVAKGQFDKLFNDTARNQLILTYHTDVALNGNLSTGEHLVFMDKATGKASLGPKEFVDVRHIYMYDNKLFFLSKTAGQLVNINYYDLVTKQARLIYQAYGQIINFYNMSNNRILVNAMSGSTGLTENTSRLAIVDYETQETINITDAPNIYQAFSVGNKIVYFESSFWFGTSGVMWRANVYDLTTGKTYSRTDFNGLGLGIPTSDSTFLFGFGPPAGGLNRLALVNVNSDLQGLMFNKEDLFDGLGIGVPPIVGGNQDPKSSILYFMNNERLADGQGYNKNLKTGFVPKRDVGEIWSMNLSKFSENYVGKFQDAITQRTIYGGYQLDNRFVSAGSDWFLTSKLYGTIGIKNQVLHGVSVYPNPTTKGFITINTPEPASIEVYSITGQVIFSQNVTGDTQIPIQPGLNILKVTIDDQTQIFKIVGN